MAAPGIPKLGLGGAQKDESPAPGIPKLGLGGAQKDELRPRRSTLSATPRRKVELETRIGRGTYGSVWSARAEHGDDVPLAVKILPLPAVDQGGETQASLEKEIDLMRSFNHEHIVAFYDAFINNSDIWVVMERCELGSLNDLAHLCPLDDVEIGAVCRGVLLGLQYLHSERHTIHRDIKGANILITNGGVVKLADFGVSAVTQGTLAQANTVIGSPLWMAPEVITGGGYTSTADVWSLGITAMELAAGGHAPHEALPSPLVAMYQIVNEPPPRLEPPHSELLQQFVAACLVKEPAERPGCARLLERCAAVAEPPSGLLVSLARRAAAAAEEKRQQEAAAEAEAAAASGGGAMVGGTISTTGGSRSTATSTATRTQVLGRDATATVGSTSVSDSLSQLSLEQSMESFLAEYDDAQGGTQGGAQGGGTGTLRTADATGTLRAADATLPVGGIPTTGTLPAGFTLPGSTLPAGTRPVDELAATVARLKQEAVELAKAGDKAGAVQALRRSKVAQMELDRLGAGGTLPGGTLRLGGARAADGGGALRTGELMSPRAFAEILQREAQGEALSAGPTPAGGATPATQRGAPSPAAPASGSTAGGTPRSHGRPSLGTSAESSSLRMDDDEEEEALREEERLMAAAVAAAESEVQEASLPVGVGAALDVQLQNYAADAAAKGAALPPEVMALNARWLQARAARAWGEATDAAHALLGGRPASVFHTTQQTFDGPDRNQALTKDVFHM